MTSLDNLYNAAVDLLKIITSEEFGREVRQISVSLEENCKSLSQTEWPFLHYFSKADYCSEELMALPLIKSDDANWI